jgi:hypothetical protein
MDETRSIVTFGSINCGRLFLRCKTLPIEVARPRVVPLVLGEHVFINAGATVEATQALNE